MFLDCRHRSIDPISVSKNPTNYKIGAMASIDVSKIPFNPLIPLPLIEDTGIMTQFGVSKLSSDNNVHPLVIQIQAQANFPLNFTSMSVFPPPFCYTSFQQKRLLKVGISSLVHVKFLKQGTNNHRH